MSPRRKKVAQRIYNNFRIITKDAAQRHKLWDIYSKHAFNGHFFYLDIMNEIGVGNELMEIIRKMRWENLFLMHLDI